MDEWLQAWGVLLATTILVCVTGYYAVLTRSLARSAMESARYSSQAAEHAARSLTIAAANVNVSFELQPLPSVYRIEPGGRRQAEQFSIRVESAGATVFVHGARLDYAFEPSGPSGNTMTSIARGVHLEGRHTSLPARLHRGEDVIFYLPMGSHASGNVAFMGVTVAYSLDGEDTGLERRITWRGEEGVDYWLPHAKRGD